MVSVAGVRAAAQPTRSVLFSGREEMARSKRRKKSSPLSLEHLEPRILLAAINPGDVALLNPGDTLYFIQGEDATNPDDLPGAPKADWIVMATYTGPAGSTVQFYDSIGNNFLQNGSKIGDIVITGGDETSELLIQRGEFLTGFSLSDVGDVTLVDRPDTDAAALLLTVPAGESGTGATYNTGRLLACASGEDIDYYKFSAQEAERFEVAGTGAVTLDIGIQYDTGAISWKGVSAYTVFDDDPGGPDLQKDDITVYVMVDNAGGNPYTIAIDRTEVNYTFDVGPPLVENVTCAEDLPNTATAAMNLNWDGTAQTGLGVATPEFRLEGNGLVATPEDYFRFSLGPYATLVTSNFVGPASVMLEDAAGIPLANLMVAGGYQNATAAAVDVYIHVSSVVNWGFDCRVDPMLLSNMVDLVRDPATLDYVWWSGSPTPWMADVNTAPADAPDGSGVAVVTGDITFSASCTGFDVLAIDGSLKGSIGAPGATLDTDETIHEIMVGYIHGNWSNSIYLDGNLDRLLVRTTVSELAETDQANASDVGITPAEIYVGGYLMEFQASGTILADVTVGGVGTFTDYVFDYDACTVWDDPIYEGIYKPTTEGATNPSGTPGVLADSREAAYIVGSPTGDFTIHGEADWATLGYVDSEDWYAFVPGLGETVTVQTTTLSDVWVYAPSGRLVALVNLAEPTTFLADEAGIYYIQVGAGESPHTSQYTGWLLGDYTITVAGCEAVHLGGIRAGSDLFTRADTTTSLEFGDDMTDSEVWVGYNSVHAVASIANLGFIEVPYLGLYGDVSLYVTGDVGCVTAELGATDDGDYTEWTINGDLDRWDVRTGDVQFNFMTINGNLGELYAPGRIGASDMVAPIDVAGCIGAVVAGGDFYGALTVLTGGIDLFSIGGDFGSTVAYSRLDAGVGANVGFVHVGGTIYDLGNEVTAVTLNGGTGTFVDDGGAMIFLTPNSIHRETLTIGGVQVTRPVPATLTYRYLPIGRAGGGPAGAALTEIVANDSVVISVGAGHVHLPTIQIAAYTGTTMERSYVTVTGRDLLSEADIYRVEAPGRTIDRISNNTLNGDILNVNAGSINTLYARGHIGIVDRYVQGAGRLLNPTPTTWAATTVNFVSEGDPRYFNGVVVSGNIDTMRANGSIGDVYVGGSIDRVYADANNAIDGDGFNFRGMAVATRTWDGIAGVLYAAGDIDYIAPGSGLFGGHGGVPVGGIFSRGNIGQIVARNAVIGGPVMASGNIDRFTGTNTVLFDATIGAGADFSDWTLWDRARTVTTSSTLGTMSLTGGGILSSVIEVGVLGSLRVTRGFGIIDSDIWAAGDATAQKGIGSITVSGGGIDATNNPSYGGVEGASNGDIASGQKIGTIRVTGVGVDMTNVDIRTLRSIDGIYVQGDIVANVPTMISAPFGIRTISANEILGLGSIGTGRIGSVTTRGNIEANIQADGPVSTVRIGGILLGDFEVIGPDGYIGTMTISNRAGNPVAVAGNITSDGYIGALTVSRGDVAGAIQAGASNAQNQAIGRLRVSNGDLLGDVTVVVNVGAVRPGGGIGNLTVSGILAGDVTTTSYYSLSTNYAVTADIGTLSVTNDVTGDITVQRNNPLDPNDPGGIIRMFNLRGDLAGDVYVEGGIGTMRMTGGRITDNGLPFTPRINVALGNFNSFTLSGYGGGAPVIDDDIVVAGNFGRLNVTNGVVAGDLTVGGTLGTLTISTRADLQGQVTAGNIGTANISGPSGVVAPITAIGNIGRLTVVNPIAAPVTAGGNIGTIYARAGTAPGGDITAGAGLNMLRITGNAQGDVTLTGGNLGTMYVMNGNLDGDVDVQNGNIGNFSLRNGQVTDNLVAAPRISVNGDVGAMTISFPGGNCMLDDLVVTGLVSRATITGTVVADITIGTGLLTDGVSYFTLRGDMDGELTVQGEVGTMMITGGRVTSNANPLDPRIEITGNVASFRMSGYTGGNPVVDDEILIGDRLASFWVQGGNITGTLTAGSMGTINYATPGGVLAGADIISNGDLDKLTVTNGPIDAPITVFHHVGLITARRGITANGDIVAGLSGVPGAGLDRIAVSGGNMEGDLTVVTGNMASMRVTGTLQNCAVNVAGTLTDLYVSGNYTDADVQASALSRVTVLGVVSSTIIPHEEIHALTGSFTLRATGTTYTINNAVGQTINNIHAYVA